LVTIRLTRRGAKKRPFYRINVAEKERACSGKFIETVGTFNPLLKENQVNLKQDRVQYWLSQGAKPSQTVKILLNKHLKTA